MFKAIIKKIRLASEDKAKIICIGSSAKDIFFPTKEGLIFDTPDDILSQRKISFELGAKYQIEDRFESLGGCAANVSAGLARLGIEVSCYTKTGNDIIGDWIKKEMEGNGIQIDFVGTEDGCKSDLSTIIVDSNSGERVIFFNRDANERLEIDENILKSFDWVFVSALNGKWEENLKKIMDVCQKNSLKLAFNPGQRNIKDNPKLIMEAIKSSNVLVLNKDEAIEILSLANITFEKNKANDEKFLLQEMSKICPGSMVLTDGQKGAWFISGSDVFHAPAIISQAADSTGAGDSFTSAFLSGYLKNLPIEECIRRGISNSSSVVRKFGAIEGLLDEMEISQRIKNVKIEKIS